MWSYYKDELNNPPVDNYNADLITNSASFKHKSSITGKTPTNGDTKEAEFAVPLKDLSNFWKTLDMPLIKCEVALNLTWSKNCVLTDMITHAAVSARGDNPARPAIPAPTSAAFTIKDYKLNVPVVTLSAGNDNKLLDQLKTGFKRTIKGNKYRSEMSNETANNNLNYLIDPTFTNVNRLFALSSEKENDRVSFSKYYLPKVEIKHFNVFIDGKPFFEIPVKNEEEAYEAIIEMSKNNDYTPGKLLDYEYFKDHYKLIAIDLSKQTELEKTDLKQLINTIGSLEEDAKMFFIIEKKEETTFDFSQNYVTVV